MNKEEMQIALEYLLISNLNLRARDLPGPSGNQRLVQLFFALLKLTGDPTIFCDIGANDGSTAVAAKQAFPQCRVVSLEANPLIHKMYVDSLTSLGIESINVAASSSEGPVSIFAPRTLSRAYRNGEIVPASVIEASNTGKTSLFKRNEDATYEEHTVPSVTIDNLLKTSLGEGAGRTVALWIDVEGAAYEVLEGATQTLRRTSVLLIETDNYAFWKDQKLSGPVARLLISQGFIPISRDREYSDKQFNTIFMHASLIDCVLPSLYKTPADLQAETSGIHAAAASVRTHVDLIQPRVQRSCSSLAASAIAEIPVYVPTFNNPTYTSHMVRQLKEWNLHNIVLVDNGSTYGEMLRYLEGVQRQVKVLLLQKNDGPRALVSDPASYDFLPDLFCVTDPDLLFEPNMPQDFLLTLLKATKTFQVGKAGLALDIADRTFMHQETFAIGPGTYRIWEWEQQFWTETLGAAEDGSPIYRANVDTTFALYNKKYFTPSSFFHAVRIAGRYTCKHLPWYKGADIPAEEKQVYRENQKFSFYTK